MGRRSWMMNKVPDALFMACDEEVVHFGYGCVRVSNKRGYREHHTYDATKKEERTQWLRRAPVYP